MSSITEGLDRLTAPAKEKRNLEQLLSENERLEKIKAVINHERKHIIPRGQDYSYIPASLTYESYNHQWIRDSSKGILHLLELLDFAYESGMHFYLGKDVENIECDLAKSINTLWKAAEFFVENISKHEIRDISRLESKLGKNHVLGRFEIDENTNVRLCEADRGQLEEGRSWQMQYDSVPLIILATNKFIASYGTERIKESMPIAKKVLPWLASYMMNYYTTPCADAWEQYYSYNNEPTNSGNKNVGKTIDSYSLSALYAGIGAAKGLADTLNVPLPDLDQGKIEEFLFRYFVYKADSLAVQVLSKSKKEYGETMESIDSEAVEIFRLFKPKSLIGSDIEFNTINTIERTLIGKNTLPIRYKFFGKDENIKDSYFDGGRWLPNGLELAMYYVDTGEIDKARKIIEYVENKISLDGSLPEQELVDPASPNNDPSNYFAKNGNSMINCLWWSETAYLAAVSKYMRAAISANI